MEDRVHTSVTLFVDRNIPPRSLRDSIAELEGSGVVDSFLSGDQLTSFCPRSLWKPDIVPMAEYVADPDSASDAFVIAGCGVMASTTLGVVLTTDAIRRGPAELVQTMLTLAHGVEGQGALLMLGAGEVKQLEPFGYRRAEGLDRMEDIMRAWNLLLEAEVPVDFEGKVWRLEQGWVGTARPYRPEIWAMGGGPRLIDIAVHHADGYASALPQAYSRPEQYAEAVADVKQRLDSLGRDPDEFGFGLFVQAVLLRETDVPSSVLDNDVLKFFAATSGRLNQADWDLEGIEPVMPRDYHYSLHLLPAALAEDEARDIAARVTPEMAEKSYLVGTPADVARQIDEYVDAGATHIFLNDLLPLSLPVEDAMSAPARTIECFRHLKDPTLSASASPQRNGHSDSS